MKPKITISTLDWRDDNDQIETQLLINNIVIDDYCGDSCYLVEKVLKHLGYETQILHYNNVDFIE